MWFQNRLVCSFIAGCLQFATAMHVHPEQRCLKGKLEADFASLHSHGKMKDW